MSSLCYYLLLQYTLTALWGGLGWMDRYEEGKAVMCLKAGVTVFYLTILFLNHCYLDWRV